MKAIVLSGGSGTRLWPVSRKQHPKQTQPLVGRETLLEMTLKRLLKFLRPGDITIATSIEQYRLIQRQVAKFKVKDFSLEPMRRDTAAAIGLAAVRIHKRHPKEVVFTANTDHYISPASRYVKFVKLAARVTQEHPKQTVLIGVNPTYPETGYGYIKMGRQEKAYGKDEVFRAERFVEKPDLKTAEKFLRQWDYLWNPAMFFWQVDHLVTLYQKHLPKTYRSLMKIQSAMGSRREEAVIRAEFSRMEKISIDYGIMEKLKNMLVVPAGFTWQDIGNWRTVKDVLSQDESDNVVKGPHISIGSSGNLVYSLAGKLIATVGVKNIVVIDTKDALLVCDRNQAQDVKKIVELLEKRRQAKYL
ncbi:MAG: sugar phosphate nucleotidyltransferase [bacterium]|nr:sugar phosphate nucleotidyltransferase [bacterium]